MSTSLLAKEMHSLTEHTTTRYKLDFLGTASLSEYTPACSSEDSYFNNMSKRSASINSVTSPRHCCTKNETHDAWT